MSGSSEGMPLPQLDEAEREILGNQSFLLTKHRITEKAQKLLYLTYTALEQTIEQAQPNLPEKVTWQNGKVSKGENYRGLPYLVLDCPKAFGGKDIFTYRTMLWWGHQFSATLHLQGAYLMPHREKILSAIEAGDLNDYYVSVGDSPWEYHFSPSNYLPAAELNANHIRQLSDSHFIKLSYKWPLDQWDRTPAKAVNAWQHMAGILFT